jgi:hypothetical protein
MWLFSFPDTKNTIMKSSLKDTLINFFSNLVSVVLGIVITFSVQGLIDRAQGRKEVRTGLELVRTELTANIEDIRTMSEYLEEERASAQYLLDNRNHLERCPVDSVDYHAGVIFAEASITLSRDAMDLMTMSSLFQQIGDNLLSMKIIRAYDTCRYIVTNLNQHIAFRNDRFERAVNENTAGNFVRGGNFDIVRFLKTDYGAYSVRWLANQTDPTIFADVSDLEEAIEAIDAYLIK